MVEALVKPELLVWGRDSAGFSIELVAKKMQLKPEKLTSWETGSSRPTFNQLLKLAQIYKRPVAVFYLPSPPKGFSLLQDFRKLPGESSIAYTPELTYEIRRANFRRETAVQLLEELQGEMDGPTGPGISTTMQESTESFAKRLRAYLGVGLAEQFAWKGNDGGYDALSHWKEAVESKGVLVFQAANVDVKEMRGFSIYAQVLPVIVLNNKDAAVARIFTLIHEFTHLALGSAGICNLNHSDKVEVYCNGVAGEFLIPKSSFLNEPEIIRKTQLADVADWSDSAISALSKKYSVSRQVVLRRLQTLSLISSEEYGAKQTAFEQQAAAQLKIKTSGGPTPPVKAISSAGSLFTRLVLAGYHREKLTGSDVSEYLNVKVKHFAKIEELVSL